MFAIHHSNGKQSKLDHVPWCFFHGTIVERQESDTILLDCMTYQNIGAVTVYPDRDAFLSRREGQDR
ncbi:hypothetical protein JTE90_011749 [Oedothorax gibbosus]|uniref:Uncharacterized protein n=1 Tax=Oedothorax gibbosus TaxID=931172 RepID=A0AAV6TL53_9ARAC|nr:hypothetical protein JTE90_011749 [Oedothorax gibbosus]